MKKYISTSPTATSQLAKRLVKQIKTHTIMALSGELGAGKTHFTKGLAAGLGIKQTVNSPTFVVMKKYPLPKAHGQIKTLIHIDCYRLETSEELTELGWEELIKDPANLIVVEWAEKIKTILPPETKWIKFKNLDKNRRQIEI